MGTINIESLNGQVVTVKYPNQEKVVTGKLKLFGEKIKVQEDTQWSFLFNRSLVIGVDRKLEVSGKEAVTIFIRK